MCIHNRHRLCVIHLIGGECFGEVTLHRSISMTDMECPVRKKRNYDLQSGLKQRWKPFGWSK